MASPRSGSSWFAGTLGRSPSVVYRREPLSQAWLQRGLDPFAHLQPGALRPADELEIRTAFSPDGDRRALVKEVAPLRVPAIRTVADPLLVELVRHPLAVAASQHERGWRFGDTVPARFAAADADLQGMLEDIWSASTALVRTVAYLAAVQVALRRYAPQAIRVRYEDFQTQPGRFHTLAQRLDIDPPAPDTAAASGAATGAYGTVRPPGFDPHHRGDRIDRGDADEAHRVWRAFGLTDYPDEEWRRYGPR